MYQWICEEWRFDVPSHGDRGCSKIKISQCKYVSVKSTVRYLLQSLFFRKRRIKKKSAVCVSFTATKRYNMCKTLQQVCTNHIITYLFCLSVTFSHFLTPGNQNPHLYNLCQSVPPCSFQRPPLLLYYLHLYKQVQRVVGRGRSA